MKLLLILSLFLQVHATVITFGSCNKHDRPQPLWEPIMAENPDVFIWGGDNIYADTQDMKKLRRYYEMQKDQPGYKALRQKTKVVGIWDDHDYGINNGGRHYTMKHASKEEFLTFFDIAPKDPRRLREGIYHKELIGTGDKTVSIYLLDTRTFKDYPGNRAGLLGKKQWKWLMNGIKNDTSAFILIVSGIQVLAKDHRYEKWANYPFERDKLLALLKRNPNKRFILLSGDRHFAEVSAIDGILPYPLYDITSSGLTHSYTKLKKEKNTLRKGAFFTKLNYGVIKINWGETPWAEVKIKGKNPGEELTHSLHFF